MLNKADLSPQLTSLALSSSEAKEFWYNIYYSSKHLHRLQRSGCTLARIILEECVSPPSHDKKGSDDCLLRFLTFIFCEFSYPVRTVFRFLILFRDTRDSWGLLWTLNHSSLQSHFKAVPHSVPNVKLETIDKSHFLSYIFLCEAISKAPKVTTKPVNLLTSKLIKAPEMTFAG